MTYKVNLWFLHVVLRKTLSLKALPSTVKPATKWKKKQMDDDKNARDLYWGCITTQFL